MQRVILFFSFLVFLYFSLTAQCITGNCLEGYGEYVFKSGAKYSGQWQNGQLHGQGTLIFPNNDRYEGKWRDNKRTGKGDMFFSDGRHYSGDWLTNEMTGEGEMTYPDGRTYSGEWLNGAAHGFGHLKVPGRGSYTGQFRHGNFHGEGTFNYINGTQVSGTWKNDKLIEDIVQDIHQEYKKPDSETDEKLRDCNSVFCKEGRGRYVYADGTIYEGDFSDGIPSGEGVVFFSNGDVYSGEWHKNSPAGEGVLKTHKGRTVAAIWRKGRVHTKLICSKYIYDLPVKKDETEETKIYAVIIGIAQYDHMPSLRFSDDDAYQLYAFLRSPEGGALQQDQIKLLIDENATKLKILQSMREVFGRADENDVVMLYFSGHGLEGSFLSSDYDGLDHLVTHDEIKNIIDDSDAGYKICYADACHAGSFVSARTGYEHMLAKYYQTFEETTGGTALIMSSKDREVSLESQGLRQGIFSHFLIRGLGGEADTDQDKIITISELFHFIQKGVQAYTQGSQSPVLAGDFDPHMPVGMVR